MKNFESKELREDRLEGKNAIIEAFRAGRTIDKLWIQDGLINRDANIKKLVKDLNDSGAIIYHVPKAKLDAMSQTMAHQGLICQVAMQKYYDIDELIDEAFSERKDPIILIMDEIQDAYNLGSIFRIAEAASISGIILPKRRQVGLDAVVAKASAGATSHVKVAKVNNIVQTMELLTKRGFWIADTIMDGENVFTCKHTQGPLAIVIGNEGRGVSPLVSKKCDFHLTIPMLGKLNSLNAAVASGIIIFEIVRKRNYDL